MTQQKFIKLRNFRFNLDKVTSYYAEPNNKKLNILVGIRRTITIEYPSMGARDEAVEQLDKAVGLQ